MTAPELAGLLQARRSGAGWSAKCPAHNDRSPSLSIQEGDGGRTLLRCWAGCSLDSILKELNLSRRDLFSGPSPHPAHIAAMHAAKREREAQSRAERQTRLTAIRKAEKLQSIVNALGGKLVHNPENDSLVALFHQTCDLLHNAETAVDAFYEPMRRTAQDRRAA
jgi:hypothetical protein